jgi:type IV pilus assembly protein PilM
MEGSCSVNHNKSILGIHIDDEFLNIVHLEQSVNGFEIRYQTAKPLDAGVVKEGLIIDEQTVSREIREFIKTNNIKTRKTIMSLSCSSVRLKPSEFQIEDDKQLRKKVENQIAKYSLFGGEKIVFDYCVFGQDARLSNKLTVLEAVTTKQTSDACLAAAQKAGLELVRIEPAVLPAIKLVFNKQVAEPDTVSLLLVLDSASANLSIFKGNLPQLCQNVNVGTKDLLRNENAFGKLTEQTKPVLEFAYSLAGSRQLAMKVMAVCNSEELETIAGRINENLSNLEIEQINLSQISEEFNVQGAAGGQAPIFALSCALTAFNAALFNKQLNLISKESVAIQRTHKEMTLAAKAIVAIVLLSIAVLVPLEVKVKNVQASLSEISEKVSATFPSRKKTTNLKVQINQLKKRVSAYDAACGKTAGVQWGKVLQVIGDVVPNQVRIVDISTTDSGEFTLTGESLAERYIYKFEKELRDSKLLENAKVEKIEYDDRSPANIIVYKIICRVRPQGNNL